MKTPNLGDAHCGEGALQSQQTLFLDSFWRAASYGFGCQRTFYHPGRVERFIPRMHTDLGARLRVDLPHGLGRHRVVLGGRMAELALHRFVSSRPSYWRCTVGLGDRGRFGGEAWLEPGSVRVERLHPMRCQGEGATSDGAPGQAPPLALALRQCPAQEARNPRCLTGLAGGAPAVIQPRRRWSKLSTTAPPPHHHGAHSPVHRYQVV